MTAWIEVSATFAEAPEDWSPIIEFLRENGCENSLQEDSPPAITTCVADLPGAEQLIYALRQGLTDLGAIAVVARAAPDTDWAEVWKQHFKPRRVGDRFVIKPTWEAFEAQPADLIIELDPGQAFGTGEHPTTRGCLELMEGLNLKGKRVADFGCGSGILSIAAALMGAADVAGFDIEPVAVEVARANVSDNRVAVRLVTGDSLAVLGPGPWDVVLSNLVSATLIGISQSVAAALAEGGQWVVSGILEPNWNDVLNAAARAGFMLSAERREDGWVTAVFRH
jgi:ribosomal protein L11 methyltransferase